MTLEAIKTHVDQNVAELIQSLPDITKLTKNQQRGIIARYTGALEPNFIAWMSATHISVSSQAAQQLTKKNVQEEASENHQDMLNRFARAAKACPGAKDFDAIYKQVSAVRNFISGLDGVQLLVSMAFFEDFIAQFMPYLAQLAAERGSKDFQYTDVHSAGDVEHTKQLYAAVDAEMALNPTAVNAEIFQGVKTIRNMIEAVLKI